MKAFAATDFGGPEQQELLDLPVPVAGPGQILVKVHAAGVNPADWKMREGWLGKSLPLPMVMGLELSGTVEEIGEGVESFSIGDRAVGSPAHGHGAFAEHSVLDADRAFPIPAGVTFADAAVMPVAGATAYDGIRTVEIEAGQTLVILGAGGGVGSIAAQIAKTYQLNTIGVASESKRRLIESTGAKFVPSGKGAADRVREAAAGKVHLILDLVGGEALRELAPLAADPAAVVTAADPNLVKELGGTPIRRTPESLEKALAILGFGLIDARVKTRHPLEDAAAAIAQVEDGHAVGKVIVEIIPD